MKCQTHIDHRPLVLVQGYGFLSENATFVDICSDHGIEFIGPEAQHIRVMGDKSTARDTMKAHCIANCVSAHPVYKLCKHRCMSSVPPESVATPGASRLNGLTWLCGCCFVSTCFQKLPQAAGVPTVPGSDGLITSEEQAMRVAREVHTHRRYYSPFRCATVDWAPVRQLRKLRLSRRGCKAFGCRSMCVLHGSTTVCNM